MKKLLTLVTLPFVANTIFANLSFNTVGETYHVTGVSDFTPILVTNQHTNITQFMSQTEVYQLQLAQKQAQKNKEELCSQYPNFFKCD